jgi:hypothetical protein
MRHVAGDIEQAAHRFEEVADEFDVATATVDCTNDLRQVATYSEVVRLGEARLLESVQLARGHVRSWSQIAVALGVSRQAARQRSNTS